MKTAGIIRHVLEAVGAILLQFAVIVHSVHLGGGQCYRVGWPWVWLRYHIPLPASGYPANWHFLWLNFCGSVLLFGAALFLMGCFFERLKSCLVKFRKAVAVVQWGMSVLSAAGGGWCVVEFFHCLSSGARPPGYLGPVLLILLSAVLLFSVLELICLLCGWIRNAVVNRTTPVRWWHAPVAALLMTQLAMIQVREYMNIGGSFLLGYPWYWYERFYPCLIDGPAEPENRFRWFALIALLFAGWLVFRLIGGLAGRLIAKFPRITPGAVLLYVLLLVPFPVVAAVNGVLFSYHLQFLRAGTGNNVYCYLPCWFRDGLLLLLGVLPVAAGVELVWRIWDKIRQGDRALLWGGFALVASCVLWSGNYVLGKLMMSRAGVSAGEISFWRFVAAGLIMFAIACATRKRKVFALTRRDAFEVAGQGMLGMCLVGLLMFQSEKLTSAINASMLDALIPVAILLGSFLTGRKLTVGQCVGMAVSLSGCLLVIRVVTPEGIQLTRLGVADLLIVAAAACWAGYVLWGKGTLKRVDSLVYTTWAMIAGAAATLVFSLLFRQPLKPPLDPEVLVLLAVLIAGPTIGAFWLWNIATRDVPLPLLNITQYLIPVCAILFAHLLLGEPLGGWQVAGMFLIAGGVALDPAVLGSLKRAAGRWKLRP